MPIPPGPWTRTTEASPSVSSRSAQKRASSASRPTKRAASRRSSRSLSVVVIARTTLGRAATYGEAAATFVGGVVGCAAMLQAVYVDLDGTLLGPGGALFADADGAFTSVAGRVVEICARAGVELVLMTGRRKAQALEDARLLGQSSYIFEAGACVVFDGEEHWLTAPIVPDPGPPPRTIHRIIEETGAPALLLERYAGRLEYHDPWHHGREVSHLMRGLVDTEEVDALLAEHGHDELRLLDNGVVHRRSPALDGLPQVRSYHLVPRGASKARGVAFHQQARGYDPARCIAVGDSREDLQTAAHVSAFWLVANAVTKDPSIRQALAGHPNARVAEGAHGEGVYEAIVETLARSR